MTQPATRGSTSQLPFTAGAIDATLSHTTVSGDTHLIVAVDVEDSNLRTISNVTYNGVAMTLIGSTQVNILADGTHLNQAVYALASPPVGIFNIVATYSAGTPLSTLRAQSFTNSSGVTAGVTSSDSVGGILAPNISVTGLTANDLAIAFIMNGNTSVAGITSSDTALGTSERETIFNLSGCLGAYSASQAQIDFIVATSSGNVMSAFILQGTGGGGGGNPAAAMFIG